MVSDAIFLLKKKLYGIKMSSEHVVDGDRWGQQLLHCFTPTRKSAEKLKTAYKVIQVRIVVFIVGFCIVYFCDGNRRLNLI